MAIDPVLYLFPELEDVNMSSLETKFTVIFGTCLFFLVLFTSSYVGSYLFVPSFTTKLRSKEKVFWCLAFIRAVFGFSASFVGVWYLLVDDLLLKDVTNANNVTTFMAVYVTVGFFLLECILLFASNIYFRFFDPYLFLHHFLSLIGYSIASAYDGKGHFFGIVGLLLEATTPFSCFCWVLLKCEMTRLRIWRLNQLILVHLFHCRTTLEGFFYYMYITRWEVIKAEMPVPISVILLTQLTMNFFVFTPYWTYKKMVQLLNPVDWNHPELTKMKVAANGSVANGVTIDGPQTHKEHKRTRRRRVKKE